MKVLSLFAGVGGIDLGLERAGFTTIAYSEHDPSLRRQYAAEVMAARFPAATQLGDITQVDWSAAPRIDVIAGGFPCTDISLAGKGAGIDGAKSGLWRNYADAIEALRPRGVLIENVPALTSRGLDRVLIDLHRLGYDAEWDVLAAAGVGAPHLRERIFVIAWPAGNAHHGVWPAPTTRDEWREEPAGVPRLAEGVEQRVAKLRCLGNAVVPACAEHVGRILRDRLEGRPGFNDFAADAADRSGRPKVVGYASPDEPQSAGIGSIASAKLPRAGRMTRGVVVERVRSQPQRDAKRVALEGMAPTLRGGNGMMPTPRPCSGKRSSGANRTEIMDALDERGGRALVPTPTATDAANSRNASAIRTPGSKGNPGRTLLDYADPTNGGRLLPTPAAADGARGSLTYERGNPTLKGAAKLLPTPSGSDGMGSRTLPEGTTDTGIAPDGKKYQVGLQNAAKLLPTPACNIAKNAMAPPAMRDRKTPDVTVSAAKLDGYTRENRPPGGLNPAWVEWLQGFPPGWVELP